jgi:hypothetical protein
MQSKVHSLLAVYCVYSGGLLLTDYTVLAVDLLMLMLLKGTVAPV